MKHRPPPSPMHTQQRRGFTLIETLVYLALYSIIVVGAATAVYSIFESSGRNQTAAMLEEEGAFIIGKIDWALASASNVTIPPLAGSGTQLTVQTYGGKTLVLSLAGADVQIKNGSNATQRLNNTNTSITNLSFSHEQASQNGLYPESVRASLTIGATTSEGSVLSRSFSTVKYLRK